MKRLNENYKASKVVEALSTNKNDKFIGAIVKFSNLKHRRTYHKENLFEIVGTQKCWGYDELGQYSFIDGYRVMSITCKDDFGCTACLNELEIISMIN
jgi:hypothetical protein